MGFLEKNIMERIKRKRYSKWKPWLLLIVFIAVGNLIFAQGPIKKHKQLSEKIFYGGGLGLQFGTIAAIEVNPMIGYIPIDNLYLGVKGTYQYYKDTRFDMAGTQIIGGSVFGMYNFVERVALYAEYEAIGLETAYFTSLQTHTEKSRYWIKSPLAGVGFVQPVGSRSKMVIMLLWSFNQTAYSPYQNPIVRLMFMI